MDADREAGGLWQGNDIGLTPLSRRRGAIRFCHHTLAANA
jgi:hypothetical protein